MTTPTNLNFAGCGCTTAATDRCTLSSLVCTEGVAFGNAGDLEVFKTGAAMCVAVRPGNAFVRGDSGQSTGSNMYHVCDSERGDVPLCLSTSDPTDDRIDLIVMCVADSNFEGTECEGSVSVVTGTPSPAPAPPEPGPNCIPLAEVLVPAGAPSVGPGNITDRRASYSLCSGGPAPVRQVFTSGDTWTKPAGARWVEVEVQGGGGAGGGAPATTAGTVSAGAGAEAGAYAKTTFAASALGATEQVTVGAGGTANSGAAGGAGGASSFGTAGTLVSADGGAGGGSTAATGTGGSLSGGSSTQSLTGQIQIPGGGGGTAVRVGDSAVVAAVGGTGGNSHLGNGGAGRGGVSSGEPGRRYGGGGSGAAISSGTQGARAGGAGADGVVIVRTYFSG